MRVPQGLPFGSGSSVRKSGRYLARAVPSVERPPLFRAVAVSDKV